MRYTFDMFKVISNNLDKVTSDYLNIDNVKIIEQQILEKLENSKLTDYFQNAKFEIISYDRRYLEFKINMYQNGEITADFDAAYLDAIMYATVNEKGKDVFYTDYFILYIIKYLVEDFYYRIKNIKPDSYKAEMDIKREMNSKRVIDDFFKDITNVIEIDINTKDVVD